MCSNRGAEESHGNGGSLNVGVPIQGIPVQFGGDMKSSDASKWFDQHCGNNASSLNNSSSNASASSKSNSASMAQSGNFTNAQVEALSYQFLPAQSVNAWKSCMLAKIGSQNAQHITMTSSQNGSTITLKLDWHPDALRPDAPIVSEFWADGATCDNPPSPNQPIGSSRLILCKAKPDSAVTIVLNTNQGSAGPIEIAAPPAAVVGGRGTAANRRDIPDKFSCELSDVTSSQKVQYQFKKVSGSLTVTIGDPDPNRVLTFPLEELNRNSDAHVDVVNGPKNESISGTLFVANKGSGWTEPFFFVPDALEQTPATEDPKAN